MSQNDEFTSYHSISERRSKIDVTTLGIDLAKNVFQLHGVDIQGKKVLHKRLTRAELPEFIMQLKPCLIGMEACGSSHYWTRKFTKMGHEIKIMNPQFVKPYVKTNKNDHNDAEAICEAVTRPNMRFIPIKQIDQQDIQSLHRIRSQIIQNRTALCNQIRGLLVEYGITFSKDIQQVRKKLPEIVDNVNNELSAFSRSLFSELYEDFLALDKRVASCDKKISALFKNSEQCKKIAKIPGVGEISATALVAAIGDPKLFKSGRELSAWLGLVPRQSSSGNKQILLRISKRGDCYIRSLLIHGARSVVYRASSKTDGLSKWVNRIRDRRGSNKAAVALANKNARIIGALLVKGQDYCATGKL